jgi:hypothetical protein
LEYFLFGDLKNTPPHFMKKKQPLNSTANSAHFARFVGKWAKLAVLFIW